MTALTAKQRREQEERFAFGGATRRSWSFWVTVAYLALTPWVVIPTEYGFSLGASDILFPFAIVALLRERRIGAGAARVILPIFFGFAYLATGALIAVSGSIDIQRLLALTRAVAVLTPFLVAVAHGPFTQSELRKLLNYVLITGTGAIALGWVLFRFGVQIRDSQQTIYSGQGLVTLRAGGLLGNSTSFGSLAVALAAAALVLTVMSAGKRTVAFLFVGICCSGIVIASSRASLLNIAVVLLLLSPVFFKRRALLGVMTLLLLGAGVIFLGFAASQIGGASPASTALYRLDFLNLSGRSTFFQSTTRLNSWDAMLGLLDQHWLWGTGYNSTVSIVGNAGDNSFLSALVELGVLAGACFMIFWFAVGVRLITARRTDFRWLGLGVWCGAVVQMLTVDSYRQWSSTPIVMSLFGIMYVAASVMSDQKTPSAGPHRADADLSTGRAGDYE